MKQYIQQLKWFLYASIYKLQNWWFLWKKQNKFEAIFGLNILPISQIFYRKGFL
jgi:hypothetical protein